MGAVTVMIRRTYQCPDCDTVFAIECNSDDPDPSCPNPDCDKVLEWRPQSFAIGGSNESKAVAMTQKIMEQDYGLSNFKDNAQPGESGIIRRQETKAETEIVNQTASEIVQQTAGAEEARKAFWGANAGSPTTLKSTTAQSMIAMAKQGPQYEDPMSLLHKGLKLANRRPINRPTPKDFFVPAQKAKGS